MAEQEQAQKIVGVFGFVSSLAACYLAGWTIFHDGNDPWDAFPVLFLALGVMAFCRGWGAWKNGCR